MKTLIVSIFALSLAAASAVEKNGVSVEITRRTQERGGRTDIYNRFANTQGLKLGIRNTSIKDLPEGEIAWTIVVRKAYEGVVEKYHGKETLKPLRAAQSAEAMLGSVKIGGYRSDVKIHKDAMEYDVTISHGGKETIRLTSAQNFAMLAKDATDMIAREREREEAENPRKRTPEGEGDKPKPDGEKPKPDGGKTAIVDNKPGEKPMPGKDKTPGEKMPPTDKKPDAPAVVAKPAEPPALPPENSAEKPFDFFNIKGKGKKPANETPEPPKPQEPAK